MSNDTALIDDILSIPTGFPSTSVFTDSPFPSPADPFEDYVNITDVTISNGNKTDSFQLLKFLELDTWLTYVLCGIAGIVVILCIIGLLIWLKKNKTRVINDRSDSVLQSNYQDSTNCCSCFPMSRTKAVEQRENSSSNLEFYGRDPLPQAVYQAPRMSVQDTAVLDASNLAVYIDGIEEIPNRDIPKSQHRHLPKYRYQNYEVHN